MGNMTRDELTHLSASELVDMVLQQQGTIEWLQARIAESEAPSSKPTQERHRHHHHHHRPWYKRLWASFFRRSPLRAKRSVGFYFLMALAVAILSALLGLYIAMRNNSPVVVPSY